MRRRFSRPPKEKHYVQFDASVAAATQGNILLAVADDGAAANSVKFPSSVKQIYIEFSFFGAAASINTGHRITWAVIKNPGGKYTTASLDTFDIEASNLVGQVIRAGQMRSGNGAEQRYVWAGYIKIPRRHQIFNEADTLELFVKGGSASQVCGICEYLES